MVSLLILLLLLSSYYSEAAAVQGTVFYRNGLYVLKSGIDVVNGVAYGEYVDEITTTGWGKLHISTSSRYDDEIQAYAAGYLEGMMTQHRIFQYYVNSLSDTPTNNTAKFIEDNTNFMMEKIQSNPDDGYWVNVHLMFRQLSGIAAGYNAAAPKGQALSYNDLLLGNALNDWQDVENKFSPNNNNNNVERKPNDQKCTGFVKWSGSELFFAHTTWDDYIGMLRILKYYNFSFTHKSIVTHAMSFSGYPGVIWSSDDFYISDKKIAVLETTCDLVNNTLWNNLTPQSVFAWIRVMVALRLSDTAETWVNVFSRWNSGTYNNQWLALDFKKFQKDELENGTIWLMEQLPGMVESADVTHMVRDMGYFASVNTWFFPSIFTASGFQSEVEKHGDWFTYWGTPRSLIFKRDHTKVHTVEDMQFLMTYNNYTLDPLSGGFPENAIAARSDLHGLHPPPFYALGLRCHGSMDSKVTSSSLIEKDLTFNAYGAPSHAQQPAFVWSKFPVDHPCGNLTHIGLPDVYDFGWTTFSSKN